ncbi:MAG: ferredoxin [Bacteroidetes bacterium HGW-Bacteroidetes-21]|nr:MAG: ferredoxin [Bacteroidetes bacterium HGW-Bacteroidetes-21]
MNTIIITVVTLVALGLVLAVVLFIVAQKFKVIEDPRIDDVEAVLPGANCGGCGLPGCRGFAEACVKAENLDNLFCPVGGNDCMASVAKALGQEAVAKEPMIAVIRCSGSPDKRPNTSQYDSAPTCAISSMVFSGETGCANGCLGLGDCVTVCKFDAIYIDPVSKLPVVSNEKCTACGACIKACPKAIIELRYKGKKDRRIFVSCINVEKGGIAKKSCQVACTACTKCLKVCEYDAIRIENNLAYIDYTKCKLCRKCVTECATNAIHELNFPPRKVKDTSGETAVKNEENNA